MKTYADPSGKKCFLISDIHKMDAVSYTLMPRTLNLKMVLLVGLCFFVSGKTMSQKADLNLGQTKYLSFHNNFWVNLHHFFYEQATGQQKAKALGDGIHISDREDSLALTSLEPGDLHKFDKVLTFYKSKVVDQPLIRSGKLLAWLENIPEINEVSDTAYGSEFSMVLGLASEVYGKYFWDKHSRQNEILLERFLELLAKTEDTVLSKMEKLSGNQWKGRVRVDICRFGNWAGAYSPADDNIVVSTIDPSMNSTLFVEFVFHESSHLLFGRSCAFRKSLKSARERIQTNAPHQLWHAAMFFLCGRATEDALREQGIDHQMIMTAKSVFLDFYDLDEFRSALDSYYEDEIDVVEVAALLMNISYE